VTRCLKKERTIKREENDCVSCSKSLSFRISDCLLIVSEFNVPSQTNENLFSFVNSKGINLQDSLCLRRKEKCQKVIEELQLISNQHICLITAPPYTGKTSTITMLEAYLRDHVADVVIKRLDFSAGVDWSVFNANHEKPTYFLIDEVHFSYNNEKFWGMLKGFAGEITRGGSSNLFFILFGAYSYCPTVPSSSFYPAFQLGLPFLKFSENEMKELFEKFHVASNCLLPYSIKRCIFNFLSNHPGLTVYFLRSIKKDLLTDAILTRIVDEEVSRLSFVFFCHCLCFFYFYCWDRDYWSI
jgi:hypothetical protein